LGGNRPYSSATFQIAGRPPLPMAQRPQADLTVVSPEYFRTLGIPLDRGRLFDAGDTSRSPDAVVNETFARKILGGGEALGQRILFGGEANTTRTIVGVVGNIRGRELGAEPGPLIYRCECQGGNSFLSRMALIVRTTAQPRSVLRDLEAQIYSVDRNQPVSDVKTMEERVDAATASQRFQLSLIGTFAALALLLAAAGVYGVMSYLVSRRTRELGIRMALGARPHDVMRQVMQENLTLVLVAVVAGLGGAWALTRYLKTMLYGVTAMDAATLAIAPVVLAVTVALASLGPARRAGRVDPMTALREE
jgi:predicted permease